MHYQYYLHKFNTNAYTTYRLINEKSRIVNACTCITFSKKSVNSPR